MNCRLFDDNCCTTRMFVPDSNVAHICVFVGYCVSFGLFLPHLETLSLVHLQRLWSLTPANFGGMGVLSHIRDKTHNCVLSQ
jgi:hypothetical protein